jgi:hypothetical protein
MRKAKNHSIPTPGVGGEMATDHNGWLDWLSDGADRWMNLPVYGSTEAEREGKRRANMEQAKRVRSYMTSEDECPICNPMP